MAHHLQSLSYYILFIYIFQVLLALFFKFTQIIPKIAPKIMLNAPFNKKFLKLKPLNTSANVNCVNAKLKKPASAPINAPLFSGAQTKTQTATAIIRITKFTAFNN